MFQGPQQLVNQMCRLRTDVIADATVNPRPRTQSSQTHRILDMTEIRCFCHRRGQPGSDRRYPLKGQNDFRRGQVSSLLLWLQDK